MEKVGRIEIPRRTCKNDTACARAASMKSQGYSTMQRPNGSYLSRTIGECVEPSAGHQG